LLLAHAFCNTCQKHAFCNTCQKHAFCNTCQKHAFCNTCQKHAFCNSCKQHVLLLAHAVLLLAHSTCFLAATTCFSLSKPNAKCSLTSCINDGWCMKDGSCRGSWSCHCRLTQDMHVVCQARYAHIPQQQSLSTHTRHSWCGLTQLGSRVSTPVDSRRTHLSHTTRQ
jgi:hypothetical protein